MKLKKLSFKQEHYLNIIAHARAVFPSEAVGLVAGSQDGHIAYVHQLTNIATELDSFFVDPYSHFQGLKAIKELSLAPIGLYHSHPNGPPELSAADIYYARRHDLIQIILSFGNGGNSPMIRAYSVDIEISEIEIVIL